MLSAWLKPPRNLIALFIAVAMLVATAFGWLSWRVIQQDRAIERQRILERRDAEAASAANSLQRVLLDVLEHVTAEKPVTDEAAVLVVLGPTGVETVPRGRLLYYPILRTASGPPFEPFTAADSAEPTDHVKALAILADRARSPDPAVRAGALLRIARIHRKAERYAEALHTYEQLSRIEGVRVAGEPVSLAARYAISQIPGQQAAAAQLRDDLRSGRWQLSKTVYALYSGWLNAGGAKGEAFAEAVAELWREWPSAREAAGWSRVRHMWIDERPIFVFKSIQPRRMAALVAGAPFLEKRWRGTLLDDQGRVLLGRLDSAPDTIRVPLAGGLPWLLQIAVSPDAAASAGSVQRRRLMIGGLGLIGLFALAAGYFIARAAAREFALARLQSDFVSAVSHEFRTPLTTMRQLTELLKKRRVLTEEKREEYYDLLARESERLQRLVEDVLDFRRMEAGAVEFAFEPLDPAGLLRGVVADFQQKADAQGYQIEFNAISSDAPPVRGDRESLRRAIWNLLENAVKYSPDCRTVWVELGEQARQVAIRVRDRGIGIPANEQAAVFQKFVRGRDAKSSNIAGTGLGLAMVRHIARSHGGKIEVSSRPGEGSTFTLLLPALE